MKPLSLVVAIRTAAAAQADRGFWQGTAPIRIARDLEEIPGANHFTIMNELVFAGRADHDADPAVV